MELDSGSVTRGATDSADALEKLRDAIQGGTTELREMQSALRNLKGSALASDETVKGLKDRIAASKASLASNTLEMVKSKGAFDRQSKPVDKVAEAIKKLDAANKRSADIMRLKMQPALERNKRNLDAYGPAIGGLMNKLGNLSGLLSGGALLAGFTAVAAGIVAVAAATVVATATLVGYAIAQADARRSDLLRLEGLSKVRNYWQEMVTGQRRAADSAGFLQSTIDGVAAGSALSRDRIGEMTSELYRAGLRGGRLKDALEGLAIVESTQGKESAAAFKARAMGAALYGTSIKALSNDVKARLGGVARAQMLSLDVQSRKAHENISHLFDGIKIEKFLEGLSKITEMFSQNTASGRALKALVEGLLQPLIDTIATTGPIVKKFFQGVVIGALVLAIAILKVRNALRDAFGGSDLLKGFDATTAAITVGAAVFGFFATAALLCVGALAALGGIAAGTAFVMYKIAEPFIWATKKGAELAAFIFDTNWLALGATLTQGIAAGIKAGAGAVADAMTSMGAGAILAFKKKLGIASPSKVAFRAAAEVPNGIVAAHEAGQERVRNSAGRLASAAGEGVRSGTAAVMPGASGGGGGGAASGGRAGVTVTIEQLTIGAGQNPEQIKESLREAVEEIFERTAHAMGAQV